MNMLHNSQKFSAGYQDWKNTNILSEVLPILQVRHEILQEPRIVCIIAEQLILTISRGRCQAYARFSRTSTYSVSDVHVKFVGDSDARVARTSGNLTRFSFARILDS